MASAPEPISCPPVKCCCSLLAVSICWPISLQPFGPIVAAAANAITSKGQKMRLFGGAQQRIRATRNNSGTHKTTLQTPRDTKYAMQIQHDLCTQSASAGKRRKDEKADRAAKQETTWQCCRIKNKRTFSEGIISNKVTITITTSIKY